MCNNFNDPFHQNDSWFHSSVAVLFSFEIIAPSLNPHSRYLGGGLPGESPRVAKASTQSREHLAAVKQALRALGFNKQVLTCAVTASVMPVLKQLLTPGII